MEIFFVARGRRAVTLSEVIEFTEKKLNCVCNYEEKENESRSILNNNDIAHFWLGSALGKSCRAIVSSKMSVGLTAYRPKATCVLTGNRSFASDLNPDKSLTG